MTRNPIASAVLGLLAALALASGAIAGPVANYPAASTLDGTEKIVATQAAHVVNVTPAQIAAYVSGLGSGVASFNTRTGAVTLSSGDVTTALGFTPLSAAASSFSGSAAKWTTPRTLAITGDLAYTSPSLDGSANVTAAGTLATVNANVGACGDSTHVAQVTLNAKGLATGCTAVAISASGTGTVTTTGSPASGNLAKFSGATSIVNGDLSGDVTTTSTLATTIAANAVTNAKAAQASANTMKGNWTSGTANEADNAMPSCSTSASALKYTTSTGIGCNTAIDAATLGGSSKGTSGATIPLLNGANTWSALQNFGSGLGVNGVLCSATAPTISSGFGTGASVVANNGTCAFQVNVGTGGTATTGTIGLPTAPNGWVCSVSDITSSTATVFYTKQTGSAAASASFANWNTSGANVAWAASDKLQISCFAY